MTSATQANIAVNQTWKDIAATDSDLKDVDILVQNVGGGEVQVVFGGSSAPSAGTTGIVLARLDRIEGNASNVWVRCTNADGSIAAMVPTVPEEGA